MLNKKLTITYEVGENLYLNITNQCPCNCTFCIRNNGDGAYGSDSLWLEHEPTLDEIRTALDNLDLTKYKEIVFCGYGEPTCRLNALLNISGYIKSKPNAPTVRLNTNGLSNLINKKTTSKLICSVCDVISISLNAPDKDEYMAVTRPKFDNAFEALIDFTKQCVAENANVRMTVVDVIGDEALKKAEFLCDSIGVPLWVRKLEI